MTKMRAMWVLAAPAAGPAQIVRPAGKTSKTVSSGLALPSAVELPQPHGYAIDCVPDAPADPPNLRLDALPLSPRPPPR